VQRRRRPLWADRHVWQALQDELILFPQAEHDDLFDGLQTAVEGAMKRSMGLQIVQM